MVFQNRMYLTIVAQEAPSAKQSIELCDSTFNIRLYTKRAYRSN